jgi:hypothetical protein
LQEIAPLTSWIDIYCTFESCADFGFTGHGYNMASLTKMIVHSLFTLIFSSTVNAAEIDAGYDPYAAAQEMINKGLHSWEWGTAAEALLELYNPELSVFSSDPFPEGKIPNADSGIFALRYAEQYINTNGQVFVDNSAVGDPASLGVSAILLGQSNSAYIDASNRQADYILNDAPRWTNGAISHRPDVAELWADNMAMSFPFCTLRFLALRLRDQFEQLLMLFDASGLFGCTKRRHRPNGNDSDTMWPAARYSTVRQ